MPGSRRSRFAPGGELVGITRMLSELKMQFDFIDADSDWSRYSVLVLPDDILLNEQLAFKVEAHLKMGKK